MKKKNFKDLPSEDTPINSANLNGMQNDIEESVVAVSPTKPLTKEKVWFQTGNTKKILTKNANGVFEEFDINKTILATGTENPTNYFIDGKRVYLKIFNPVTQLTDTGNTQIFTDLSNIKFVKYEAFLASKTRATIMQLPYMYSGDKNKYAYFDETQNRFVFRSEGGASDYDLLLSLYYTKK